MTGPRVRDYKGAASFQPALRVLGIASSRPMSRSTPASGLNVEPKEYPEVVHEKI